jgi:thioredoxin-related protein
VDVVRFFFALAFMAALLVGAAAPRVDAALDAREPSARSGLELLVFQVEGCHICDLVQTRIRPAYERSPKAAEMPMRFVDVNAIDEGSIGLATPITLVPTIVLMRDGREVGRLAGYTGPELFFEALTHMLDRAD